MVIQGWGGRKKKEEEEKEEEEAISCLHWTSARTGAVLGHDLFPRGGLLTAT